jgi:hypothetical protein
MKPESQMMKKYTSVMKESRALRTVVLLVIMDDVVEEWSVVLS